jgi:ABC-type lipoprotein release transport system permease subunit
MKLLLTISLRNLFRQKRRNVLLGIAIGFGTMILILASAFSHGISEVLFNQIIAYVSGHVSVNFSDNGNQFKQVFHDGPRFKEIVKREIPEVSTIVESMGVMARAIGNAKSDNVIMVGVDLTGGGGDAEANAKSQKEAEDNFKMVTGNFKDLGDSLVENPVILSVEKAEYLNVKKGDILRVRYKLINGQDQASRLTVVGIFKPANIFMSAPVFLEINNLKKLLGYGPNDIGILFLTLKNPKLDAVKFADRLQAAMQPSLAGIAGTVQWKKISSQVTVLGFKTDSVSKALLNKTISFVDSISETGKDAVLMSESLATVLGVKKGDLVPLNYRTKYDNATGSGYLKITTIFKGDSTLPSDVILSNDLDFYKTFYSQWPADFKSVNGAFVPAVNNSLNPVFSQEWILLPRVKTTTELSKLQREIGQKRLRGTSVSVQSMYESASAILQLEVALNMITLVAVMILFFIILIGVINTLRMTVRERTREIGTIRAIGMQKNDVKMTFVLETFFLSLFSAIGGTALAFAAMKLFSMVKIDAQDNPLGMLLTNGHLNFAPTILSVVVYILLIITISVATAYFPARRASNLSSAEALRHFE